MSTINKNVLLVSNSGSFVEFVKCLLERERCNLFCSAALDENTSKILKKYQRDYYRLPEWL